jgi:glyoxylase-like metal-dependent hydrolase (beta-lactamase superfamily II)
VTAVDGRVERWSERVARVLAPNPSPLTLEGTNTFVVAAPGASAAVVIDPGPALDEHAERVLGAAPGGRVELVLLTHGHADHAAGARRLADRAGAPLAALDPDWATRGAPALSAGAPLDLPAAGVRLEPLPTPGHAADHCCFWLAAERAMFTGDHVLGRGTTVVEWPGGDMRAYLRSLEALLDFDLERLYPGHGPAVGLPPAPPGAARAKIREYLEHRRLREAQVLAALAAGDRTPAQVVARVYADVDPTLHPAAELSVRAHLAKLLAEGRVRADGDRFVIP